MVGLIEFSGMVTALRNAADLTKWMIDAKVDHEMRDKISKLQQSIISAQTSALVAQADHAALVEEARTLKAQIAETEDWEREAERYALESFPSGAFVYVLKAEAKGGEPMHSICPSCYTEKKKSILQERSEGFESLHASCPRCKLDLTMKPKNTALQREARRQRSAEIAAMNRDRF